MPEAVEKLPPATKVCALCGGGIEPELDVIKSNEVCVGCHIAGSRAPGSDQFPTRDQMVFELLEQEQRRLEDEAAEKGGKKKG